MSDGKVFDIDRLQNAVAGTIKVDGVPHAVLQITGAQQQSFRAARAGEAGERMYEIVAACVPTLTHERVLAFNRDQVAAIFGVSGAGVAAVEALFPPNVESPATSTSPG